MERTWEFEKYTVIEEIDVLRFENNEGDVVGYVSIDGNADELADELDNGANPIEDGWEDGIGNTLDIDGWGSEE